MTLNGYKMVKTYDEYYQKKNYFGNPYPGLVDFFRTYPVKSTIPDLGCGQGRDSLVLARLGYKVTAIDLSSVGIEQLNQVAKEEDLDIRGQVRDIYDFEISEEYDMVLLDSIGKSHILMRQ